MKTIAKQLKITKFPFTIKDSNGNEIYREWSDGYWLKREWDTEGNEIYCEHSNGFWTKSSFWIKREWAGGNQIYYEDSAGLIKDNRPGRTDPKQMSKKPLIFLLKKD